MTHIAGFEQARIRRDVDEFFDKTAAIYSPTTSVGSNGARTLVYPSTPTRTSPAQLAPMGNETDQFYADRLGGKQGYTISMRSLTTVRLDDRIKIDGRTFEVLGRDTGRSYQWRTRVAAKELT